MGRDVTALAHEGLADAHRERQAGWLAEASSRKDSGDHRGVRMVLRDADTRPVRSATTAPRWPNIGRVSRWPQGF